MTSTPFEPIPVGTTTTDLGRPVAGDVVALILEDQVRFESLLRQLRDSSSDREAVRHALSTLHVAHAEAEERHVELGRAFVEERQAQIDADCGRIENVRALVARAADDGLLSDDGDN
jgi:hypothetical protein